MKLKTILVLLIALVACYSPTHAQEGTTALNAAGDYEFSGAYLDGTEAYKGTAKIEGNAPIYTLNFTIGDTAAPASPAITIGNVIVDASGETSCSDTIYSRHSDDGTLIGMWIDTLNGNGLGLETLIPTEKTTGFEGTYRVVGTYASGTPYDGTVVITAEKDGLYALNYHFDADAINEASDSKSVGMVSGDILGVASPQNVGVTPDNCSLFVASFQQDGSYTASYYRGGKVGSETGKRNS